MLMHKLQVFSSSAARTKRRLCKLQLHLDRFKPGKEETLICVCICGHGMRCRAVDPAFCYSHCTDFSRSGVPLFSSRSTINYRWWYSGNRWNNCIKEVSESLETIRRIHTEFLRWAEQVSNYFGAQ